MALTAMLSTACDWTVLTIISMQFGPVGAGLFRAAVQFATPIVTIYSSISLTRLPAIARAAEVGDLATVRDLVRSATVWASLASLPFAALLWLTSEFQLSILGAGFAPTAGLLRILILGQVVAVITGPTGMVLAILGRARIGTAFALIRLLSLVLLESVRDHFLF
jgi:O-antigen/teichoic acid export membrane protein